MTLDRWKISEIEVLFYVDDMLDEGWCQYVDNVFSCETG